MAPSWDQFGNLIRFGSVISLFFTLVFDVHRDGHAICVQGVLYYDIEDDRCIVYIQDITLGATIDLLEEEQGRFNKAGYGQEDR